MKNFFVPFALFCLFGSFFGQLLPLDTLEGVVDAAVSTVTGAFDAALYPVLSLVDGFDQVFHMDISPEEAEKSTKGATEYIYKAFGLTPDKDKLQQYGDDFKNAVTKGFSPKDFVSCISASFEQFLTLENKMSPLYLPDIVQNYVDSLITTLGYTDEEKLKDNSVVSPYHAAVIKANVLFLKLFNDKISKSEMVSMFKAFFDEMHRILKEKQNL